ncbi:uncharacterized protein LOC141974067 [Athene noctua]|uniref:uncharacterized protein LOC141974067 n=1 Tax=Athene noctua TaxID=126797 RepID=UPI003EB6C0A0
MTWLLREVQDLEQRTQEQSGFAWQALLFAALQQRQFWATAGLLGLLLGLCWWLRKRSPEVDSGGQEESSSSNTEREEEQRVQGFYQAVVEPGQQQEDPEQQEEESEGEDPAERDVAMDFAKRIQWRVQNPAYRSQVVEELAATVVCAFRERFSDTFLMVLQPPIGVGSAFEGWSPCEDDAVYCLLVPQKRPRGHSFHLELFHLCLEDSSDAPPDHHSPIRRDFLPWLEDIMQYLRRCLEKKCLLLLWQ